MNWKKYLVLTGFILLKIMKIYLKKVVMRWLMVWKITKKIEICVFAAIHIQVSRLVKQSYRLEAHAIWPN